MVLGPLAVYPLDIPSEKVFYPHYLGTGGRVIGFPIASGDAFAWTNDKSQLRGYQFAESGIDFTVRVHGGTSTGVSAFAPILYVGSESGYVFAYDAQRGNEIWEFATGSPIRRRPVTDGKAVYVSPVDGGMYSLNPTTGLQQWFAPDPIRFVAATPDRVYSYDRYGWLVINDAHTGARLGDIQLPRDLKPITNDHTDRLVLYTDDGLIQCLHEPQYEKPLVYAPAKPKAKTPAGAARPPAETPESPGNIGPAQ